LIIFNLFGGKSPKIITLTHPNAFGWKTANTSRFPETRPHLEIDKETFILTD